MSWFNRAPVQKKKNVRPTVPRHQSPMAEKWFRDCCENNDIVSHKKTPEPKFKSSRLG